MASRRLRRPSRGGTVAEHLLPPLKLGPVTKQFTKLPQSRSAYLYPAFKRLNSFSIRGLRYRAVYFSVGICRLLWASQ
jgi:hypothetical protein